MRAVPVWIWVFLAGGAGAVARYALAAAIDEQLARHFPSAGTLAVNLIGCLLIGALSAIITDVSVRTALLTGLLGGFTTYSAFALLTHELAASGRWGVFGAQISIHLVGGLACAAAGLWIGRVIADAAGSG